MDKRLITEVSGVVEAPVERVREVLARTLLPGDAPGCPVHLSP
ncbi:MULTISPECIES: hypothetical protein [unclassified Nonomuraea]